MIPPLDERGLLPVGIHQASWTELFDHFANDARRISLLSKAKTFALAELAPQLPMCRLILAGSTFSDKPNPGDIESTIIVSLNGLEPSKFVTAILLQARHDEIKELHEVDFYVSLDAPGANDFSQFFQYVGEKTAAVKHLEPKDKRGIVEVMQWIHG